MTLWSKTRNNWVCMMSNLIVTYDGSDEQTVVPDEERTRCEVWTRVMGYHRPVNAFNVGKQQEHRDRKQFKEACCAEKIEQP